MAGTGTHSGYGVNRRLKPWRSKTHFNRWAVGIRSGMAAVDCADVGQDLRAPSHLDGGSYVRELGDQHLACIQAFRVVGAGVSPPREPHYHDPVLQRLDNDVAAGGLPAIRSP